MKTIKVVAAVIKAVNENGKPIFLPHNVDTGNSKGAGSSQVEKLNLVRLLKKH